MADIIKDYSQTVMLDQHSADQEQLADLFRDLEERGRGRSSAGKEWNSGDIVLERFLDMRYEGQSYEIIVPFEGDYLEGFHQLHEKTYGYRNQNKTVEIVNLRLRARGTPEKPVFEEGVRFREPYPKRCPWCAVRDFRFHVKCAATLYSVTSWHAETRSRGRPSLSNIPPPS